MKPDAYMPFYWDDFWQSVKGQGNDTIVAYQRCLWHYWKHTHCAGLENDDEFLRLLSEIEITKWVRTRGILFDSGKFFSMGEDGFFHQKRAAQEYAKAVEQYENAVRRGKASANARWNKHK